MQELNEIDIVVALIIVMSTLSGFYYGFLRSMIKLIGWIGVAYFSYISKPYMMELVESKIHSIVIAGVISYTIVIVISMIFFSIFNSILIGLLYGFSRSSIDKILGFGFGILRGSFFVVVIFTCVSRILSVFNDGDEKSALPGILLSSISYPYLSDARRSLMEDILPENFFPNDNVDLNLNDNIKDIGKNITDSDSSKKSSSSKIQSKTLKEIGNLSKKPQSQNSDQIKILQNAIKEMQK
ncbi:CvpA family protein [Lyticum sinuosum]|uniref:CvpA family protein n=1 Tax=Lyticum sinuosum TaxID=1332059 RepID=A0AAE5AH10_9RICK|nr:CvpA family protein [Lyticum sinuosum]MDZ5761025.1 CvpA family protein [Lyticum sinuosum]